MPKKRYDIVLGGTADTKIDAEEKAWRVSSPRTTATALTRPNPTLAPTPTPNLVGAQ